MSRFGQAIVVLIAAVVGTAGAALAQDNFEAGKKPAQMFVNDCGACHKSPAGLSKAPGIFGLESFLREHYTASKQAASAIAAYIRSVDAAQPPPKAAAPKRKKNDTSPKAADRPAKPGEAKPADAKATETKPAESKAADPKPAEPKTDAKASNEKPADSKPAEPPAAAAPPAAKTDKSD